MHRLSVSVPTTHNEISVRVLVAVAAAGDVFTQVPATALHMEQTETLCFVLDKENS